MRLIPRTYLTGGSFLERDRLIADIYQEAQKCINCGFCESVCPTLPASGYRESFGARGRVNLAKEFIAEVSSGKKASIELGNYINSCLSCYACLQVCPAGVNAGHISDMLKRAIADEGLFVKNQENAVARMIVSTTLKYMDPLGLREECTEWARGIRFEESGTILYTAHMYQLLPYIEGLKRLVTSMESLTGIFAGIISSSPQLVKAVKVFVDRQLLKRTNTMLRNISALLRASGIRFSYLGANEPYPGTLLYDMGYVKEFSEYANRVYSMFNASGVKEIITIDPHTYDLLKNVYPKYVSGFNVKVYHYLDLLNPGLFKSGDIRVKVTYHEPCHFVRRTGYNLPKDVLEKTSALMLPRHNGRNTMCCGGPDEAFYPRISNAVSERRFMELKETGADFIITACPICFENLNKDESVVDISEWLSKLVNA